MSALIRQIAYYPFFGKPLTMYLGILTIVSFLVTATLGYLIFKGYSIPIKVHKRMAFTSLTLAIIHGLFGISVYFNY